MVGASPGAHLDKPFTRQHDAPPCVSHTGGVGKETLFLIPRLVYLQIHSVKWQPKRARVGDVCAVQPDTVAQSAAAEIRLEVCVATEHLQIAFRILKYNPGTSGYVT